MSAAAKAVFLSYASQDAEAAKRLCDALRGAGVEVWFDAEGGLEHGDEWDAKIRRQIKECVLFIPVISANTQAREEGYFRLEWELAAQRSLSIASGVAFILPVVIDATKEAEALVPDRFRTVQWTKLPNGAVPPEVLQRFLKLWSHRTGALKAMEAGRARPAEGAEVTLSPVKKTRGWLPIAAAVGAIAAVAVGWLVLRPSSAPLAASPVATAPAAPSTVVEWPRDPELRRAYQLANQINSIREDHLLAEEVAKKAVEKAPSDPEAVTVLAHIESTILLRNFDFTADRTAIARRYCERAVQLAPDNPVALAALAIFLTQRGGDHPRAEELLRRASSLDPAEPRYARHLAQVVSRQNGAAGSAAALKLLEEAAARFPGDALVRYNLGILYRDNGDYATAERLFDETIALAPIANAIDWKARFALMRSDLAGTKVWLDRVPARMQAEERAVLTRVAYAFFSGDVSYGLNAVNKYAEPWFYDVSNFTGPRSLLLGSLREREGNLELARTHYEAALTEVRRYRETHPADPGTQGAEAWALLGLGRVDEARAAHRVAMASLARPARYFAANLWWFSAQARMFLLDDRDNVLTIVREMAEQPEAREPLLRRIRMDPRLAKYHQDPELVALLAPAAAAAKADDASAAPDEKSVAVLAFRNLSDDKANEYFSDGISEELLNVLAKVPGLKVSARTSAFFFKGKDVPMREISRQLGVAYVVDGSVRKAGDKVRITAQLIKAADGFQVWTDTFTRDLKDIFAVQDEIAALIARNISPKLTQTAAPAPSRPVDPEAFQLYLEGRALAAKAGIENLRSAIALFDRALVRAPGFSLARAQAARAYVQLGRWGGMVPRDAWAGARAVLAPALAADPDLPEVLVAQGWLLRTADWKWREAERAFARALEQRPSDTDMLVSMAVLKAGIGESEEALTLARRAVELDPLNPATQFDLGLIYRFSDHLPDAERQFRRAIELSPGGQRYRTFLAIALAGLKRYDEAEELARNEPDELSRMFVHGLVAGGRGDRPGLLATIADLEAKRPTLGQLGDYSAYLASMKAAAGDLDGAFAEINRTREGRDPSVGWIKVNYLADPMRADPRWPEFLRSVGLADEQLR